MQSDSTTMGNFILLDTVNMSEYFFENALLYGIGSYLSPILFCQKLNNHFRLNFKREFNYDWYLQPKISGNDKIKKTRHQLFEPEDIYNKEHKFFFPVFYDNILSSDTEFYIYTNKLKNLIYIKHQKQIDYFLLIKNGLYIDFVKDIQKHLMDIDGILYHTKYNLADIHWKDNLIL